MEVLGTTLTMKRGDDDSIVIGRVDGLSFVTGDTATFSLKTEKDTFNDILEIVADTFIEYNEVPNAGFQIDITHDDTIDLPLGKYYYDIYIKWADGTGYTPIGPTNFNLTAGGSDND